MRNFHKIFVIVFLFAGSGRAQVSEIQKSLICMCECGMTVAACEGAMECSSAARITSEVRALVGKGLSNEAVMATLVDRYGEKIMAAPSKKGFNLTAWVLPFLLIISVAILLYVSLIRWSHHPGAGPEQKDAKISPPLPPKYKEVLDKELDELD